MPTHAPHPPQVPATPPTPVVVPELHDLLWGRFTRALGIKRRLHVQRAFMDELRSVSRGKRFHIRNEIVWNAMVDVCNQLVTDLYSLTVEMRHGMKPLDPEVARRTFRGGLKRKRGLFIEIRDHHRAKLLRTYVAASDDDEYEIERYTDTKAEVFAGLFPACTTDSPAPADIECLCEEFRLKMVPLGEDRNKNRAHAQEGDFGTAKMLSNPELEALFEYVEDLLENLSMISALTSFARDDMNHHCKETAADLVDLIMFGNISDVTRLTATRTRDELYARLHEIDDAAQPNETDRRHKLHFNDRQWAAPFEDFVALLNAGVRAIH